MLWVYNQTKFSSDEVMATYREELLTLQLLFSSSFVLIIG